MSNAFKRRLGGRKEPCQRCGKVRALCAVADSNTGRRRDICRQCLRSLDKWLKQNGVDSTFIEMRHRTPP